MHEADKPDALFDLSDTDGLAGEDLTEIDFSHFEADAAAGGDGDGLVVEGIVEFWQAFIGPGRRAVELGWATHADRLVRPLGVVAVDEAIELGLLLKEVLSSGLPTNAYRQKALCRTARLARLLL